MIEILLVLILLVLIWIGVILLNHSKNFVAVAEGHFKDMTELRHCKFCGIKSILDQTREIHYRNSVKS